LASGGIRLVECAAVGRKNDARRGKGQAAVTKGGQIQA
jgi:hypothetical protein